MSMRMASASMSAARAVSTRSRPIQEVIDKLEKQGVTLEKAPTAKESKTSMLEGGMCGGCGGGCGETALNE